jgi:uroporphyrinogen-III decarboxylase
LQRLVTTVHQAGKHFAFVMTTGTLAMSKVFLESGIDLLYYIDPVQGQPDLDEVKRRFSGSMALAGGVSSAVTLHAGSREEIKQAVQTAACKLGPTGFILAPVDALFPDTPWAGVEAMVDAWREAREVQ